MKIHPKESENTRRQILAAAKKEFAEKGYSGARMNSIASNAGVNQALIHYYFASKENIYRTIFQNLAGGISEVFISMIDQEISSWGAAPDVKLCAAIYMLVNSELNVHDEEFHRIVAHEIADGNGIIHEFIQEYLIPQLYSFEKIINEGIACGIFMTSDTALITLNILSFVRSMSHGEEFLRGSELHEKIYGNRTRNLYPFMLEFAFKALVDIGIFDNIHKV